MTRWLSLLCILLVNTAPPTSAWAQNKSGERITNFDSQVTISRSGEIEVTETITVQARGNEIRRGIFRDFPTQRGRYWYGPHRVAFEVLSVTRDDQPESWFLERNGYATRLYMGESGRMLRPGTYTYTITYRTDRQIGFFDDRDEFIWNVTGNFWAFPIEHVTTTIIPPGGSTVTSTTAYTGAFGTSESNAKTGTTILGYATAETTQTLQSREGLTVAVRLPQGSVRTPDITQRIAYLWRDGAPVWVGLIGLFIVTLYYSLVWAWHGKDPDTGTIIPRYNPPDGVGPAACRYILSMGWDAKGFTAAIVNLAAKGFVSITEFEQNKFKLTRTSVSAKKSKLTPGETAVALKLFGEKLWTSFVFRAEHHAITDSARKSLKRSLKEDFENIYFFENKSLLIFGTALSALTLAAMAAVNNSGLAMGAVAITLSMLAFAFYPLFIGAWTGWQRGEGGVISLSGGVAILIVGATQIVGLLLDGIVDWFSTTAVAQIVLIVLVIGTNMAFYHLLKAPSRLGRKVMDHIEGFRHYLQVAEKDRLNFHNPPDVTPEIFERYLPFAIALDVENEWGTQFDLALDRVGGQNWSEGSGTYEPTWFHSSYRGWSSPQSFATEFTPTFGKSVVSSLSPPGNTRGAGVGGGGFSGGGFSGGGGGGGGGGGW